MKKINLLNLEKQVKDYAQSYYEGNPQVSDSEFDNLVNILKSENPNSTLLKTIGWGYNVNKVKGSKHQHDFGIVGSLDKVHHVSELDSIYTNNYIVVTEKLDGASCVAYYERGKLFIALSRGNGEVGIDVTDKFRKICEKYDLTNLEKSEFSGAIRGEIVMSYESWNKYKELHNDAKSPRNVATGLLMRDDVINDLEYIDFVPYKIHGIRNHYGKNVTYLDVLRKLFYFGFKPIWCKEFTLQDTITDDKLKELFEYETAIYPRDGFVLQVNDGIQVHDNGWFEYTNIAYKFEAHKEETKVVDVEWKLSKNNIMVPVVIVEPTELSGAVVTRSSGFNYDFIKNNNVGKGAVVKLMRSGEVIPYIKEIVSPCVEQVIPDTCPKCGSKLHVSGKNLVCNNLNCPNVEYSRLYSWIEFVGVRDILGVGPALIDEIINCLNSVFNIKTLKQLYTTMNSGFVNIDISTYFPTETAKKVKQVIQNLKKPFEVENIIVALNIQGLGEVNAKKCADIIYKNIDNVVEMTDKMRQINGVGDSLINTVVDNIGVLQYAFSNTVPVIESKALEYKYQVTVTGSISIPRDRFKTILEENNILLSDNIRMSKYLITNNPNTTSSKMKKAKELGIQILTEKEFCMLEDIAF